jgi:hypothetical protein
MKVFVPSQLRDYTSGRSEVHAEGATLLAVLGDLDRQFPGFRFRVIDEHERVRRHIIFFVGEDREEDVNAPLRTGADITIVGALSGG